MKVVWQESAKVGRREVAAYIRKEFGIKNKITQEYVIKAEIERFPPFSFVVSEIMLKFAATPIVRKGEVGQNFSGKKDVNERYLRSLNLASSQAKKKTQRDVHIGCIVCYPHFMG